MALPLDTDVLSLTLACNHVTDNSAVPPVVEKYGPLLVIGAGFGRTGTKSLKVALEMIYGQPCYHMFEAIDKGPNEIAKWAKICRAYLEDPNVVIADSVFEEIFNGYRCSVDHPGTAFVFHLMKLYPDAKVVLTIRDIDSWFQSFRESIQPRKPKLGSSWMDRLVEKLTVGSGMFRMARDSINCALGNDVDIANDEQVKAGFHAWNARVESSVPKDRLLVFSVKSGWEPLCAFLGVPIPGVPFPHVNQRAEIKRYFGKLRTVRTAIKVVIFSTIAAGASFAAYKVWLNLDRIKLNLQLFV